MLTAILVAAGSSRRMRFDKLFATIAGKPVIAHSLIAFDQTESVNEVIVVAQEHRHAEIEKIARNERLRKLRAIVRGGEHRHDSVRAGLEKASASAKYISVHDAARPLITPQKIELVFRRCRETGAASLAEPIRDTIKRVDADFNVSESVDRQQLYAMQTPQIFDKELFEQAYRIVAEKKLLVTDEVSAVELTGRKVAIVINEDFNFKITYPRDLALAEFVLLQTATNR